jgi:hypothetical protein
MVFGSEEGAMVGSVLFGGSRSEKVLSHYSIGSEYWYKIGGGNFNVKIERKHDSEEHNS